MRLLEIIGSEGYLLVKKGTLAVCGTAGLLAKSSYIRGAMVFIISRTLQERMHGFRGQVELLKRRRIAEGPDFSTSVDIHAVLISEPSESLVKKLQQPWHPMWGTKDDVILKKGALDE